MRFCLLLLLFFGGWAHADSQWREVKNLEVNDAKRAGWALEVPKGWERMSVNPPPPIGEGFQDPSGKALVTVTWVGDKATKEDEQVLLPTRGYMLRTVRVGGRDANEYFKERSDGGTERVVYIFSPQGGARLFLVSKSAGQEETFRHILLSFRILAAQGAAEKAWKTYRDGAHGYTLKIPNLWDATPQGAQVSLGQSGLAPSILISVVDRPQDQSFRGWARNAGKTDVPGASLDTFQPLTTEAGANGYMALWVSPERATVLAYLPLGGQALVARLNNGQQLEIFNKVVRSIKL